MQRELQLHEDMDLLVRAPSVCRVASRMELNGIYLEIYATEK